MRLFFELLLVKDTFDETKPPRDNIYDIHFASRKRGIAAVVRSAVYVVSDTPSTMTLSSHRCQNSCKNPTSTQACVHVNTVTARAGASA